MSELDLLVEEWLDAIVSLLVDVPDDQPVPIGWIVHGMAAGRHFPPPAVPVGWRETAGYLREQARNGKRRLAWEGA
jgi:hypothetical protein